MQATKSKTSLIASTLNSAVRNTKLTNLHHSSVNLQNLLFVQMGFRLTLGRKPWHKQYLVCTSCLYAACQLCSDSCVMHVPLFLSVHQTACDLHHWCIKPFRFGPVS